MQWDLIRRLRLFPQREAGRGTLIPHSSWQANEFLNASAWLAKCSTSYGIADQQYQVLSAQEVGIACAQEPKRVKVTRIRSVAQCEYKLWQPKLAQKDSFENSPRQPNIVQGRDINPYIGLLPVKYTFQAVVHSLEYHLIHEVHKMSSWTHLSMALFLDAAGLLLLVSLPILH